MLFNTVYAIGRVRSIIYVWESFLSLSLILFFDSNYSPGAGMIFERHYNQVF